MTGKLKSLFPMIRTREEILKEIRENRKLSYIFDSWEEKRRQEYLDTCSGVKGVKLLYDSFFKAIVDPERDPERLSGLLTLILEKKVRVVSVLPHEGGRITPRTLVVMDIIVQLRDGSLTTVEVQRYGYAFPGQRAACYSADMLLRQYRRKRDEAAEKKKRMSYKAIRPVYTIVLYEQSPGEFARFPHKYIHRFSQRSDTGLEMELLEKYVFIALDNFKNIIQNRGIRNRLEAWLAFLCMDEPEWILRIIEKYPRFRVMYEEVYEMCRNLERVMEMYSKELLELDEGTVQYMIDEMQEHINEQAEQLSEQAEQLKGKDEQLSEQAEQLKEQAEQLKHAYAQMDEMRRQLQELGALKEYTGVIER